MCIDVWKDQQVAFLLKLSLTTAYYLHANFFASTSLEHSNKVQFNLLALMYLKTFMDRLQFCY